MAAGDSTLYSLIAPPEAKLADVHKLVVDVYLDEENPPASVIAEPLGRDPQGNSVWGVTVTDGPEKPQEASGGAETHSEGGESPNGQFEKGGP